MASQKMIEMEIKQLRTFITILETQNLTKAAQILNLVQPAVTKQLQLLEDDLGTSLFKRSRLGMTLTQEGKRFEPYARRILEEVEKSRFVLRDSEQEIEGKINIGVLSSVSELLSTLLMKVIKSKYPKIQIKLSVGYSGHLKQWLEDGDIDIALMYGTLASPTIRLLPLVEEALFVIGSNQTTLNEEDQLSLEQVSQLPMILPYHPHRLRALVEQALGEQQQHLNIYAETNDLNVQKHMVMENIGYTILPLVAVRQEYSQEKIKISRIRSTEFSRTVALAKHKTRAQPKYIQVIEHEIITCIQTAIHSNEWPHARLLTEL
jgi:LysR family transcriptional regulator, nitrogen assimilation regulatory protein